jgi:serine/threonine protein kinase
MDSHAVVGRYAALVSDLLRQLRGALERAKSAQPALGLTVTAQEQEVAHGVYLRPGLLTAARRSRQAARWRLNIGFASGEAGVEVSYTVAFSSAINFDIPSGDPPLKLPAFAVWEGKNRFDQDVKRVIDVGNLTFTPSGVRWHGSHWPRLDAHAADLVVLGMLRRSVLHDSPDAAAAALPGARWARLSEPARVQQGGQGKVWKVHDCNHPEAGGFALKEMRYEKSRTSGAYQRFLREIEATRALNHLNIVRVVEAHVPGENEPDEITYYVMPWAERTLARARDLKGNVLRVLEIGAMLADALAVAHAAGIIHRDVKPANVLLDADGAPLLCDFGICYVQTDDDNRRVTRTVGDTVGSDDYVAPELRGGRLDDVDGRVDVYSLGKTLYAALADRAVFPLERWDDSRYDLRREGSTLPLDHFYGLLPAMVATDPEARFPSMAVCAEQLKRAAVAVRRGEAYVEGMYRAHTANSNESGPSASESLVHRRPSASEPVATLKSYLTDDGQLVRVHDLLLAEADVIRSAATTDKSRLERIPPAPDAVRAHVTNLDNRAASFVSLMATGCSWGRAVHESIWVKALARASDVSDAVLSERRASGRVDVSAWNDLRYYPAVLALYAGGIAAMEAARWGLVGALLTRSVRRVWEQPAFLELNPRAVMAPEVQQAGFGIGNVLTPLSEHIFHILREPLRNLFADGRAYETAFDRFEYLLALTAADHWLQSNPTNRSFAVPVGRFHRFFTVGASSFSIEAEVSKVIGAETNAAGTTWPPLAAGLFGRSSERLGRALEAVRNRARQ